MHPKSDMRKPLAFCAIMAVLLVGLLLAGCERQPQSQGQQGVREVSTVTVETQKIMETTELPGRTAALRVAEIRPQVNGLILKRLFVEGSDVTAGQALYQIDPAPFQAALDNALAALGRAEASQPSLKARADRYKALLADKAVSQQDYDDASAALTQVLADIQYWKASVVTARINLGYTKVTAPIAGRIGRSNVNDGAIVTAYQPTPLAVIQQFDPIYVDVPQSTTELLRLRQRLEAGRLHQKDAEQNQVQLILEDGAPYPQEGALQFRDVSVNPTTGSVILRMVFPNPDGVLLPEMYVRTVVKEGVNEKAILLQQQAVARNAKGDPYALIVDKEGKVGLRMLTLGRAIGNKWLVTSGLAGGDQVIVEGAQMLRPGTPVKTVPFQENPQPPAQAAQPPAAAK
ncbi:MAG: efflux RND transporter periplasmic adaptor subunit [Pseudomonadota bacterium]